MWRLQVQILTFMKLDPFINITTCIIHIFDQWYVHICNFYYGPEIWVHGYDSERKLHSEKQIDVAGKKI